MPTRPLKLNWQPHYIRVRLPIPLPAGAVTLGRVQVILFPTHWMRDRGGWPSTWRTLPPVDGVTAPIYRWWHLGPVEIRVFRWRSV